MERFWRTLRGAGCFRGIGALTSLHDINVRLYAFLDQYYHTHPHAGLMGKTPREVWSAHQRTQPADQLDEKALREALTIRARRRVRKDSTISINGVHWESEAGFLSGRTVTVAYSLVDRDPSPWIEYEEKRFALHPVDPKANARRQRTPSPDNPDNQPKTPFDPAGALLDRALGRNPKHKEE